MRVALVNPRTSFEQIYGDWDLSLLDTYSPPLGILSLAGFIREHGHEPCLLDAGANGLDEDAAAARIREIRPDVVGISSMTINFRSARTLAGRLKRDRPDLPVVLGGPHVTAVPVETLRRFPAFDFGVLGEGECTLLDLLDHLGGGKPVDDVPGLAWRDAHGEVVINPARPAIADLDALPFPAWDLLEGFPERYPHSFLNSKRLPAASIMTSRGCPFHCSFCDNKVFGTRVRHFSAAYSIRMIEHLIDRYGIRDLMLLDDNFLFDRDKLFCICDEMIERRLDLTWYCMGHARSMTPDRLQKIRDAGCWFIEIGIESGNDAMLRRIRKGTTRADVSRAVAAAKASGLKVKGNFIFGFPGDTVVTLEESIRFALDLDLDFFQQNYFTAWPGCEIHRQLTEGDAAIGERIGDWDSLAHQRITFVPEGMTRDELVAISRAAFRQFYLRPRIVLGLLPMLTSRRGAEFLLASLVTFLKTVFR